MGQAVYEVHCFLENHPSTANSANGSGNGSVWSMNVKETPHRGMQPVFSVIFDQARHIIPPTTPVLVKGESR